jgi:tRNA A-37 threonylcarbamoyl transferase component Bud32
MDAAYEIYIFSGGSWRLLQRLTDSEGGRDRAIRLAEGELGRALVEGAIVVREMYDDDKGRFTESKIFRKFKRDDLPTLGGTQKQPGPLPGRPAAVLGGGRSAVTASRPAAAPTSGGRSAAGAARTVPPLRDTGSESSPSRPKSEPPKPPPTRKPAEKEEKSSLLTLLGGVVSKVVDLGGGDKSGKKEAVPSGGERSGIRLGRYDIISELGKGAMGVVYKAYDPVIDRLVAIKTINKQLVDLDEVDALSRLRREAQSAGRLSHPNIVSIYDYGENDRFAYIAMEFIDGKPLNALMSDEPMAPAKAVSVMRQLLAALDYSHDKKVVHRDIKPANILVMDDGLVKITDFGIARIESSTLTQAGAFLGTPAYMSPEQVRGETADQRSDLFSAGVVFYELLGGQRPFSGAGAALAYQIVNSPPPRLSQVNARIPTAMSDVIEKALTKDAGGRFQSARDFQHAIDEVLGKFKALSERDVSTQNTAKKPWYERWTFEAGREIFHQGDPGDACYVIESGAVEVIRHDETGAEFVLARVERGKVIGEMALIDNQPRMATVRAVEDTVLLVVPREAFQGRLEKLDPVTRRLLDTFTERLRAMAEEVVRLRTGAE